MKFQIKRFIAQIVFLISANLGALGLKTGFCYPFFYCHACPTATSGCPLRSLEISIYKVYDKLNFSNIKSIFSSFIENVNWKLFFYPLLILGFLGTLTGRAVCGWVCPIGLLQRTTSIIPIRLKKKFPLLKKIGQHKIEHYFRFTKYFVLISLVLIIPFFYGFMFTDVCPVGILTGTIPIIIINPGQFLPNAFFYIAIVIFILFFILIFIVERGWCRYFCPVGAILGLFNKISFLHVHVDQEKCVHDYACNLVCPMGIDVSNMKRDPECILCGKCINACPKNIISYRIGG